ncbi:MAG: phage tail spike protein [Oscillospiraceae bacterium]
MKQVVTTYRLELEIDAVNKRLKFHTRRGRDRGAYFIERLNLRSLGVKTSSYGFYTRLIPIGKDGLHLWRDGQNYIENHQYSDKVITSIWRDERYTVTAALLEDAQARLDEASTPARAYAAELVDLGRLWPVGRSRALLDGQRGLARPVWRLWLRGKQG